MDKLEEKIRFSKLLNIYKNLLTDKQITCLEDYYDYDLSLSEIAANQNVSKNAVHDLIKRVSKVLEDYEKALSLLEKQEILSDLLNKIDVLSNDEIKNTIEKVM